MEILGLGKRVQLFVEEGDHIHGKSVYLAVLERLRSEGAAGAVVTRGIAGFGAHGQMRQASLVDLASPLPLIITWVDSPERVKRLLPAIRELVPEGLITVEDVQIAKYSHRDLPALLTHLTVGEIMTRDPIAASPDMPLDAVISRLIGRSFRAMPVVDAAGQVVGIVTNGDLIQRGGLQARVELLRAMDAAERSAIVSAARARTVGDVMTADTVTIEADASISRAVTLMVEQRLKRLPVVDHEGKLLGMLSRVDILKALGESYPLPDEPEEPLAQGAQRVGDIMSRRAPMVRADAGLAEILDAVVSTRLNRAVVLDAESRVIGVLSDAEVMASLDAPARPGIVSILMRRRANAAPAPARVTAKELVSQPPLTLPPDLSIAEATRRMLDAQHKVIPIVDERGVLLGIVDRADLLRAFSSSTAQPT